MDEQSDSDKDVDDILRELIPDEKPDGDLADEIAPEVGSSEAQISASDSPIAAAQSQGSAQLAGSGESERSDKKIAPLLVAGAVLLAFLAGLAYLVFGRQDAAVSEPATVESSVDNVAADGEADEADDSDADDDVNASLDSDAEEVNEGVTFSENVAEGEIWWGGDDPADITPRQVTEDNPDGALRYLVVQGGLTYIRGFVPNQELADAILEAGRPAWGDNGRDQLVIDPSAAGIEEPTSLYINDLVLFEFNGTELGEEFLPLLDNVAKGLATLPQTRLKLIGHTDSAGSPEINRRIAQERSEAVRDYLVGFGVPPEQIVIEAVGEGDGEDDDSRNADERRVEIVIEPVDAEG